MVCGGFEDSLSPLRWLTKITVQRLKVWLDKDLIDKMYRVGIVYSQRFHHRALSIAIPLAMDASAKLLLSQDAPQQFASSQRQGFKAHFPHLKM